MFGTVFASGLYATDLSSCNPWGIAAGLLAAVSCASFLALLWSGTAKMFTSPARFYCLRWRCNYVALHLPRLHRFGRALAGHRPFGLDYRKHAGSSCLILLLSMGAPHFADRTYVRTSRIRAASWAVCGNDSTRIAHRCR